jgi:hypothetical protein
MNVFMSATLTGNENGSGGHRFETGSGTVRLWQLSFAARSQELREEIRRHVASGR